MPKTRTGHPDVFTDPQNAALRSGLRDLRERKGISQAALGILLGIGQQRVSRLMSDDAAGFSYVAATGLVRALGFAGVDSFFKAKGVALPNEHKAAS